MGGVWVGRGGGRRGRMGEDEGDEEREEGFAKIGMHEWMNE